MMTEEEKAQALQQQIDKMHKSRASYAGWLTKSLDNYKNFDPATPVSVLEAAKERIAGQLKKLQISHNSYINALTDENLINDAESWMDGYYESTTKCLTDIENRMKFTP